MRSLTFLSSSAYSSACVEIRHQRDVPLDGVAVRVNQWGNVDRRGGRSPENACGRGAHTSRTMRSMSSSDRRPFSAVIVIFSALPVPLSSADTWRMPFASISKVTSIWGTPRGAGGMPVSSNLPSLCEMNQ